MKTPKELADIGAAAALPLINGDNAMWISNKAGYFYEYDEPARQAFVQAVLDAVMDDMFPKQISGSSVSPEYRLGSVRCVRRAGA